LRICFTLIRSTKMKISKRFSKKPNLKFKTFLELPAGSVSRERFKLLVRRLEKEPNYEKREGRTLYFQFESQESLDIYMLYVTKALEERETAFQKMGGEA
jgi:hypothetical protein